MIICDKCKQPITQSFNKVNFQFERIVGTTYSDNQTVINPSPLRQHKVSLDICADCQEKIIKDVLGETPWMEGM